MAGVLRVLHILEPSDGGVAKHVLDLTAALIARDHEVELVVSGGHGFADALRATGAGVAVADLRPEITAAAADLRAARAVAALMRHGRWDVVHTHGNKGGVIGRVVASAFGFPIVHSAHGFAYLSQRRRARRGVEARRMLTLSIERLLAPATDVIVCVSADDRRHALADRIAAVERLAVVPNGVAIPGPVSADPAIAGLPGDGPVLGYLARLAPEKGPLLFVQALARLRGQGVPFRAAIVGNGPQAAEVRRAVEDAGLGDRVAVFAFAGSPFPMLRAFDIYVLPSLFESLPIGLLEAMAVGLPVIAADVGGVAEAVLHERTGLLYAPGDAGALSAAITALLSDGPGRTAMGAAGKAHCESNFSFDVMVDGIVAAYERARARRCAVASE